MKVLFGTFQLQSKKPYRHPAHLNEYQ